MVKNLDFSKKKRIFVTDKGDTSYLLLFTRFLRYLPKNVLQIGFATYQYANK